jgi:hypothetical protein
MKKLMLLLFVSVFLLWQPYGSPESSSAFADGVKEKMLEVGGSTIAVKVIGDVDVVSVKPYIKAKKGKKEGPLWLDVVIKNTGDKPLAVSVFGQGQGPNGGWHGGALNRFPKKDKLEPGKEMTAKVRTRFQGEMAPKMIRVEIFPPM